MTAHSAYAVKITELEVLGSIPDLALHAQETLQGRPLWLFVPMLGQVKDPPLGTHVEYNTQFL